MKLWLCIWNSICYFIDYWYPFIWFKPPKYTSFKPDQHPRFPEGTEAWRADLEFIYQYFDHERRNLASSTIAALCFIMDQQLTHKSAYTIALFTALGTPWKPPPCMETALRQYWIGGGIKPVDYKRYD